MACTAPRGTYTIERGPIALAGRQPGCPDPEERGGQAVVGREAALDRVRRGTPVEIDRDEPLAGPQVRVAPAGEEGRCRAVSNDDPVRRAGRQEQDAARVVAGRREQRLSGRNADDRTAEPVGEPLRGRDPDAQPGERPGPGADDDRPDRRPPADRFEQPLDRRQERLAVAVAGRPGREIGKRPVEPAATHDHARRRRVDDEHVPGRVRGHGTASR